MKKITLEQIQYMLDMEKKYPEKFTEGGLTFSVIRPWSPDAWEVTRLMEELILAGEDFGLPIMVEQHVVDEESDIDFIHKDVNVYKQFVFPGKNASVFNQTINVNILTWLTEHRGYTVKPPVEMTGELLDIGDKTIAVGDFVIVNTFVAERVDEEITIHDYLKDRNVTKGDIVRIIRLIENEFEELERIERVEYPFLYQETYFKNEPRLFRVR